MSIASPIPSQCVPYPDSTQPVPCLLTFGVRSIGHHATCSACVRVASSHNKACQIASGHCTALDRRWHSPQEHRARHSQAAPAARCKGLLAQACASIRIFYVDCKNASHHAVPQIASAWMMAGLFPVPSQSATSWMPSRTSACANAATVVSESPGISAVKSYIQN